MLHSYDETVRPDSPEEEEHNDSTKPEGGLEADQLREKRTNPLPDVKHRIDWRRRLAGR